MTITSNRSLSRKLAHSISLCTVLGAALLTVLPGRAAPQTWSAGTGTWDATTANWSAGTVWTDGNDAVFGSGTAGTVTISPTASFPTNGAGNPTVDGLDFTQYGYTIGNTVGDGTIYLGPGTTNPGLAGQSIYLGYTGTSGSAAKSTTTINSNIVMTGVPTGTGSYVIDAAKAFQNINILGTINNGGYNLSIFNYQGNTNLLGVISGAGGLVESGHNAALTSLTLDGLNTFTGTVTISTNVTINTLANAGVAQSLGEDTTSNVNTGLGAIAFNGSGAVITLDLATDSSTNREFTLSRYGVISSQGTGVVNFTNTSLRGAIFLNNITTFITLDASNGTVSDANTVSGLLVGISPTQSMSINETGSGVWAFTDANNTYWGATDINGGTLMASTLNSVSTGHVTKSTLGAPTSVAMGTIGLGTGGVSAAGTLYDTGTGETTDRNFSLVGNGVIDQEGTGNLKLSGTIAGILSPTSTTHQIILQGSSAGTGEVSGVIADAPSGSATVATEIGVAVATTTTQLTIDNAADLFTVGSTISGTNIAPGTTITAITNGSTVTLSQATTGAVTLGEAITVSGGNGGATSVVKTGTGTWTFSGVNTYTGATTVSNGTLNVTGSIVHSTSTVSNGAIMTGTGATGAVGVSGKLMGTLLTGDLTVNSGGTIAPGFGLAIGKMTATSLTFNLGGTLAFVLDGASGGASNLNLTGAFTMVSGTGTYDVNLTDTSALTAGTYDLVDFGSTNFLSGNQFNLTGLLNYNPGLSGMLAINGNQLDFVVTAIPEPGTWASLLLGLGVLVVVVRRKSSFRRSV